MNNLRRGRLDFSQIVRIPQYLCKEAFALQEGDILYGLSGSIGATGSLGNYAVVGGNDIPAQLNQRVARLKPREAQITQAFLLHSLKTRGFYEQVLANTTGTAQFNVSTNDIAIVALALPPIEEQEQIVAQSEADTASMSRAIDRSHREIDLLYEYRTRLIADLVTGKLDVREAAAQLPDEVEEPEPLDEIEAEGDSDGAGVDDTDAVPEEAEA